MLYRALSPLSEDEARLISPLRLAYIGDTVWEMLSRSSLFAEGRNLQHMHKGAISLVNAAAQAEALRRMEPLLTDTEADIMRRGRNAHARHHAPKNQSPADYAAATGLEALMGYLYLTGQEERVNTLFHAAQEVEPCRL